MLLKKIKQIFCKHSFRYQMTYKTGVLKEAGEERIKFFFCQKCGKQKSIKFYVG